MLKVAILHCSTWSTAAHELQSMNSLAVCVMVPHFVQQVPFLQQPLFTMNAAFRLAAP